MRFCLAILVSLALFGGGVWALPPNAIGPLLKSVSSGVVSVSFGNQIASASGTGTYGTAATGRVIVVSVVYSVTALGSVSSVSVSGNAATKRRSAFVNPGLGNNVGSDLWTVTLGTGTSGTVTATPSSAFNRVSMAVLSVYNTSAEAGTSGTTATALNNTVGASLAIPTNGVGIGAAQCTDSIAASSVTWINLTSVLNNQWTTAAVHGVATSSTPSSSTRTANCNGGISTATMALSVNAWGP